MDQVDPNSTRHKGLWATLAIYRGDQRDRRHDRAAGDLEGRSGTRAADHHRGPARGGTRPGPTRRPRRATSPTW